MTELDVLETAFGVVPTSHAGRDPVPPIPAPTPRGDDQQILALAGGAANGQKFIALYGGDIRCCESPSEADLALCSEIAFWTQDAGQIDRLFRGSRLVRPKWIEREDYRQRTIAKALAGLTATYTPSLRFPHASTFSPSDAPTTVAPAAGGRAADPIQRHRAVDGASFLLETPNVVDAVVGDVRRVLWQRGETLILAGPQGVAKSTVAQQIILARIGIGDPTFLEMPVAPAALVVYIAADRPAQVARSWNRMLQAAEHIEILQDRLLVWRGPLEFTLDRDPDAFVSFLQSFGADCVVIDSLKDVALDLASDETGGRVNRALQLTLAAEIDVLVLHHQRKKSVGNAKPKALDDVYGSMQITAGAGSVALLWGQPGDAIIELTHLKQPAEDVGPLRFLHEQETGSITIYEQADMAAILRATPAGLTAADAARQMFEVSSPPPNQIEKGRRRLKSLVRAGIAVEQEKGIRGGVGGGSATRWIALSLSDHGPDHGRSMAPTDYGADVRSREERSTQ